MFNIVILSGRLTANPELKTTNSGKSVCNFTIAVERKFKQGAEKPTDFIDIVAWGNTAEIVSKYFSKGSMIGIEGSVQTRKYTDKDGNNRTAFEILANNVQFMESKRDGAASQASATPTAFSNAGFNDFEEISTDDDLPF